MINRDVYLLIESDSQSTNGNPLNMDVSYDYRLVGDCKVMNMGLNEQALLFANKSYDSAKVIIVNGHPKADKIAFFDEYDPDTGSGVIYDITLRRRHRNNTAFYVSATKAGL